MSAHFDNDPKPPTPLPDIANPDIAWPRFVRYRTLSERLTEAEETIAELRADIAALRASRPIRIVNGRRVFTQQGLFDPAPDPIDASRKLHTCYEGCLCQSGKMPIEDFASYERDYRLPSLNDEDEQW